MPTGSVDSWRIWPPNAAAVEAARNGDQAVMAAIATAAIPKLVAFYRGLGMRRHDAEDLAGDTCEAFVRNLPRLRDPGRFEAWFWRIARSKFYDELRRKKRPLPAPAERDEMFDDPSDIALLTAEHDQVRSAFLALPERDRELLWMREVVGLSYAEMAGRTSLREGAIRIAVMRARRRLEAELGHLGQPAKDPLPTDR
jgi:RNA polymerase sigma-70 factor (ECF subfamily)